MEERREGGGKGREEMREGGGRGARKERGGREKVRSFKLTV